MQIFRDYLNCGSAGIGNDFASNYPVLNLWVIVCIMNDSLSRFMLKSQIFLTD
jgi:hypothetical protein